jgi:hypothetical protein
MKSLMLNVFWPAWEWGPMNMPYLRHLAFAYAQDLTTRDNNKLVKLVTSPQYRALWGDRFTMVKIGEHGQRTTRPASSSPPPPTVSGPASAATVSGSTIATTS